MPNFSGYAYDDLVQHSTSFKYAHQNHQLCSLNLANNFCSLNQAVA